MAEHLPGVLKALGLSLTAKNQSIKTNICIGEFGINESEIGVHSANQSLLRGRETP